MNCNLCYLDTKIPWNWLLVLQPVRYPDQRSAIQGTHQVPGYPGFNLVKMNIFGKVNSEKLFMVWGHNSSLWPSSLRLVPHVELFHVPIYSYSLGPFQGRRCPIGSSHGAIPRSYIFLFTKTIPRSPISNCSWNMWITTHGHTLEMRIPRDHNKWWGNLAGSSIHACSVLGEYIHNIICLYCIKIWS